MIILSIHMKNTNRILIATFISAFILISALPAFAQEDNGTVGGITDDVKKTQSCDKKYDVSGYVYVDKNENDKKDNNEDGVKGVEIRIYDKDDNKVYYDNDKTNEDGFWKVSVCEGEYVVIPQEKSLPSDTKINSADSKVKVDIDGKSIENVNIRIIEESGFNYLWVIIPVLALIAVGIIVAIAKSANQEERDQ
jgi:hypothetical protein